MASSTRPASNTPAGVQPVTLRTGGHRLRVRNSGGEAWLYDDANRARIRDAGPPDWGAGGMPPNFEASTREGLVVSYSLVQDDDIDVELHVGTPLTRMELSPARWLEPQHALLRLPSSGLCVESNDASRIGPEEPAETGAGSSCHPATIASRSTGCAASAALEIHCVDEELGAIAAAHRDAISRSTSKPLGAAADPAETLERFVKAAFG